MDLILLRHGKAEGSHPNGDLERDLVEKGRQQAVRAARLLLSAGRLPSIVLTSPYRRARQTAELFCQIAQMPGPLVQGWIGCGMTADRALGELQGFSEFERVMLVGHEPDFSLFARQLIGASSHALQVKKGALVGIRLFLPSAKGELRFLIPPRLADEQD